MRRSGVNLVSMLDAQVQADQLYMAVWLCHLVKSDFYGVMSYKVPYKQVMFREALVDNPLPHRPPPLLVDCLLKKDLFCGFH